MTALDPATEREALQLLRQAIDADPATRDALLDSVDPALASRVRSLLACVDADDDGAQASDDIAGQRIGPYRLIERIGRGGMGEVFRAARDDGAFDREVALKRIWGGFAPLTERFLRERQVLARLQHPGIAQLFDGGVTESGQPWFAMELVRGEPITRWCDARRAPLEKRVELMIEVCAAVDFAHRALIVHRDLKPANVLVGDDGHAKLLDFGIAKLLGDVDAEQTQTLAMTPAWAAPEQREGRPVTTASDVYQLGMLLRVLLADDLPDVGAPVPRMSAAFDARRREAPDAATAIAQSRGTTPERLRARLAGDLDSIVAQATATSPDERYRSAAALADDLARWRDGLPVQARRTERGYRLRRMLRRRWPAIAAALLVAVGAIAFTAFHITRLDRALATAEQERDRAQAIADFMLDVFRSASPAEIRDESLSARELLERSAKRLRASRTPNPGVKAALLVSAGRVYLDLGRNPEAEATLADAVRLMRADPGTPPEALALALRFWAQALYNVDRPRDSLSATNEAIAAIERSPRRGGEEHAGMLGNAAIAYVGLHDYPRARALFAQSLGILKARGAPSRRAYVNALHNAAAMETIAGDMARALAMTRLAVEQVTQLDPPDRDLQLKALISYTDVLRIRGDYAAARRQAELAFGLARKEFGEQHPYYAMALHHIALAAIGQGRIDEARTLAREVHEHRAALFPTRHPYVQEALRARASIEVVAGRPEAARPFIAALVPDDSADPNAALVRRAVECLASPTPANLARVEAALGNVEALSYEDAWMGGLAAGPCRRAVAAAPRG